MVVAAPVDLQGSCMLPHASSDTPHHARQSQWFTPGAGSVVRAAAAVQRAAERAVLDRNDYSGARISQEASSALSPGAIALVNGRRLPHSDLDLTAQLSGGRAEEAESTSETFALQTSPTCFTAVIESTPAPLSMAHCHAHHIADDACSAGLPAHWPGKGEHQRLDVQVEVETLVWWMQTLCISYASAWPA